MTEQPAPFGELVLCRHCGHRLVTGRRDSRTAPDVWVHESSLTSLCHPVVTFAEPVASDSGEAPDA